MTAVESSAYGQNLGKMPPVCADQCRPMEPARVSIAGLLGTYLDETRQNRLKYIIDHPLMLQGFRRKNVTYPWAKAVPFKDASWEGNYAYAWIGEHVGKWLHTATILGLSANDSELLSRIHSVADELVSYQEPDGYLGTYAPEFRLTAPLGPHSPTSWDVWTHRYNLVGLLNAYHYLHDEKWLTACKKMGDMLIQYFGPGKGNITDEGTRNGLSALTCLESVVLLYQLTQDQRYLDLACHFIYNSSETKTRVLSQLLAHASLTTIGSGKAYQLMAVLLGMIDLYRCNGDSKLLEAVLYAWQTIRDQHLHITGGPWTKKVNEDANRECFAPAEYWSPEENVETCSTVTWIQLCFSLFRLTCDAKYVDEAERALYNHLLGSQRPASCEGAYFTSPNEQQRLFTKQLHCCNSSGPRALALVITHACTYRENGAAINLYTPGNFHMQLDETDITILQQTDYPTSGCIRIGIECNAPIRFPLWLRIPGWVKSWTLKINEQPQATDAAPGTYLCLNRVWNNGDTLELDFSMTVDIHMRHHADGAFLAASRGPLVLAYPGEVQQIQITRENATDLLVPYYQASIESLQLTTWFPVGHQA